MTKPTTASLDLDLDEIAARAAALYEYALLADEEAQAEADQLAGTDVPALLAEVHHLRAQRAFLIEQLRRKDARSGEGDKALREFLGSEEPSHVRAARYEASGNVMAASLCRDGLGDDEIAEILSRHPGVVESHVVADDSSDPEHIDDCPGCQPDAPARSAAAAVTETPASQ